MFNLYKVKIAFSQWLTKATGFSVTSSPVLVFPGWFVTSQTKPPFPIICNKELNHKQLVKTIPALRSNEEVTQTLSQQQVDAIVYQVAQRCLAKSNVGKCMVLQRFTDSIMCIGQG